MKRVTSTELAAKIRGMADWIEAHKITGNDLVAAHCDGWGDCQLQLSPSAFHELKRIHNPYDSDGHGHDTVDGMKIVTVLR